MLWCVCRHVEKSSIVFSSPAHHKLCKIDSGASEFFIFKCKIDLSTWKYVICPLKRRTNDFWNSSTQNLQPFRYIKPPSELSKIVDSQRPKFPQSARVREKKKRHQIIAASCPPGYTPLKMRRSLSLLAMHLPHLNLHFYTAWKREGYAWMIWAKGFPTKVQGLLGLQAVTNVTWFWVKELIPRILRVNTRTRFHTHTSFLFLRSIICLSCEEISNTRKRARFPNALTDQPSFGTRCLKWSDMLLIP